ncbi:MAG: DUF481 domain-containing protein [Deltaproteobacteria bacterium]|nr:DUF481 domain-containing protein [Deltaproteobacteria bacterium]
MTFGGQTLQGRILRLRPIGIEFEPTHAKGKLTIPYEKIEKIVAQNTFIIYYGVQDTMVRGRLLGVENDRLLIGADRVSAKRIPIDEIITGISVEDYDQSFWKRQRIKYRHWRASLALGWSFEDGAIDKRKISPFLRIERFKKPTRYVLNLGYAFEEQKTADDKSFFTTKDEFEGFMIGEYDVTDPFFVWGRPAMDWDTPRDIDLRHYPAAGVGYRVFQKEQSFIQFPVGFGYVYENFDGFGTNSYFSLYFGISGRYDFPKGTYLDVELLYMPSIAPFADDWLYRSRLDFTVPLFDPISLKLLLANLNDDNPSPDVGNNKFTATMALSLEF